MTRESAPRPRRSRTEKAPFQQAELLSNQKQVPGELEQEVAQRTAELAEANQKLSKEIGERREIEKRLQESESVLQKALDEITTSETKLRQVIDTIPALAWCNLPDGSNEFLNRRWHEYTGLSPEASHGWGWQVAFHPEDLPPLMKRWREMLTSGEPGEIEARLRRHDGVYRWFLIRAEPLHDETGKIARWYGTSTDIEDRKRAEEALQASELTTRLIVDSIPGLVVRMTAAGEVEAVNRQLLEYFGKSLEDIRSWTKSGIIHPEDLARAIEIAGHSFATGDPYEMEIRIRRFDGVFRWFQARGLSVRDAEGRVLHWYALHTDIDDRKRVEEALRASEFNARMIVDGMPGLVARVSPAGEVEVVNRPLLEYFGKDLEEVRNWANTDAIYPDDLPLAIETFNNSLPTGRPFDVEHRLRRFDGMYRWFQSRGLPVRNAENKITAWYVLLTDIDDRKKAEAALQSNERNLRLMIDAIPAFIHVLRTDGSALYVNQAVLVYTGLTLEDVQKEDYRVRVFHPEDVERLREDHREALTHAVRFENEQRVLGKDGEYRWFLFRYNPLLDEQGRIDRWYVAATDIDDRKQAEAQVEQAYLRLAEAQRLSKTGSFITDLLVDEHNWSEEAFRIFEFDPATKVTVQMIRDMVHPEDLPSFDSVIARGMRGIDVDFVFRIVTSRGAVKHIRGMARVMEQIAGRPLFIGALQDVTESKPAEGALNKARSELAHVARVTTLNALTASIAHEVNQPLSGIITNASTCLRMLNGDPPNIEGARETVRRTIRDGNRASDVITRLRSLFSKKELTPEPLDLNDATREVIALSLSDLQRNRVILRSELAADVPPVSGDRVQLQQVILNLVRNASEAMAAVEDRPRQLLIRTEKDEGERVRLTVKDAGVGFDAQAADSLFQPFYTTKDHGMGIGLSVSRAIIEAHRGRLWAVPNEGPGATFSFSVPCRSETKVQ